MSVTSPTVPLIAITAEESDDESYNYNGLDIADAKTDIEDLDTIGEKKKKKTRSHKQTRRHFTPDSTDDEEFEGTGDEIESTLIKHEKPVSVDDVLNLEEPPTYDESFKVEGRGPRNRRKLKSQTSTSSTSFLNLDDHEVNQAITDVEDFNDSDDGLVSNNDNDSDVDLLLSISQDVGIIEMSDSVKKQLGNAASPIHTPHMLMSDNEQDMANEPSSANLRIPTKGKNLISPISMSPQLSDLTDVEILESNDSNDDDIKPIRKPRHVRRNKRNMCAKDALTDTEDIYMSDKENKKSSAEILMTESPNFHTKNSKRHMCKHRSESVPSITSFKPHTAESRKCRRRICKKPNNNKLNVEIDNEDGLTDMEEIEAGDSTVEDDLEQNNISDEEIDNVLKAEFESYYGVTEDKSSSKNNIKMYKTESYVVKKNVNKLNIDLTDAHLTDEECFDQETPFEEKEGMEIEDNACKIEFVPFKVKQVQNNSKLLTVPNDEENILTDNEYLNSSDEERELTNQFAAIVLTNKKKEDTDSEEMDNDDDYMYSILEIPENILPKVTRERICIKETNENANVITENVSLQDEYKDDFVEPNNLTDEEDIPAEGNYLSDSEYNIPETNIHYAADEGSISTYEQMKSPDVRVESEGETDYEEISDIKPSKRNKAIYLHDFLKVKEKENAKLTDCEDIELSDAENLDNGFEVREVNIRSASAASLRTDMEDLDASDDNDQRMIYTPEPFLSKQILNEICGTSTSTKEGSGPFSKQERKKLYKKNRTVEVTPASPMQTDTDEIFTSADDEHTYSRAETATPAQMRQALDDASNSKVSTQYSKKMDLEAADEVMYLKGGGFISDQYTDVEELGISEEEYKGGLGKSQVFVSIDGDSDSNINISVAGCADESLDWNTGKVSSILDDKKGYSVYASSVTYSLDIPHKYSNPESVFKICTSEKVAPSSLFSMCICKSKRGYVTTVIVNSIPVYQKYLNMLYIHIFKSEEIKLEQFVSSYNIGEVNNLNETYTLEVDKTSVNGSDINDSEAVNVMIDQQVKIKNLITKFEIHQKYIENENAIQEEILTDPKIVGVKTIFNINKSESSDTFSGTNERRDFKNEVKLPTLTEEDTEIKSAYNSTDATIERRTTKVTKSISLMEKVKLFENLCIEPRQKIYSRKKIKNEEWKTSQEQPTELIPSNDQPSQPDEDAAKQDTIPSSLGSNGASRMQNEILPKNILSYSYLDNILDNMLAEVEAQEKIVDHDPLCYKPLCVNTLNLKPPDEVLFELSLPKKETKMSTSSFNHSISKIDSEKIRPKESQSISSINTINITPLKEKVIELNVPCTSKLKRHSHINTYDFGKLETANISDVDNELDSNGPQISLNEELVEESLYVPCPPEVWYEGTYRHKSNIPNEDQITTNIHKSLPDLPDTSEGVLYGNYCSSSNESSDESYESSDSNEQIDNTVPVKAEVKLLVKTRDMGKEDIEIRSVKELLDINKKPNNHHRYNTCPRRKMSVETCFSKPTYTLQRLFIRSEDNDPSFIVNKNLKSSQNISKSQPELFSAPIMKYPLQYDITDSSHTYSRQTSDIWSNNSSNFVYSKTNELESFPSAYCDWLLPADRDSEGITTSPTKTITYSDKILIKDTNSAFIETELHSESQKDTSAITIPDQESQKNIEKEHDKDKKEKKGFFSSLFSKKDSPKKTKKVEVPPSPKISKPKAPTPEPERKSVHVNEEPPTIILNRDSIPDIDEVINESIVPVTDLDVDPVISEDIKSVASTLVDNVITDSQTAVSKILEQKDKTVKQAENESKAEISNKPTDYLKKNEEALNDPIENWKELTNDMIQNEIHFQGWTENYASKLANDNGKLASKPVEEIVKEETPKPKKSKGLFKLFGKKESRDSDESDTQTDDPKSVVTTSDSDRETDKKQGERRKKKRGKLFGIFNKKEKKEKDSAKIEEHEKAEVEISEKETKEFSKTVQQQMVDTTHFLMYETEVYEDVRINYPKPDIKEQEEQLPDIKSKSKKHGGFLSFLGSSEEKEKEKTDKKIEDGKDKSSGFLSHLGQKISNIKHEITDIVDDAKHKSSQHGNEISSKTEQKFDTIITETESGLSNVQQDVKNKINDAKDNVETKLETTKKDIERAQDEIDIQINKQKQVLKDKLDDTKTESEKVQQDVKCKLTEVKKDFKEKVDEAEKEADKVKDEVKSKLNDGKQDLKDKVNETKKETEKIQQNVNFALTDAKQDLENKITDTKKEADKVQQEVGTKLTDAKQDFKDKVAEAKTEADNIQQDVNSVLTNAKKDLVDKVADSKKEAKKVQQEVGSKLTDAKQDFEDKVTETKKEAEKVQLEGKKKLTDVKENIKDKVDETKKEVDKVHEELKFKLTEATQDLKDKVDETQKETDKIQQEITSKLTDAKQNLKDKVDETKEKSEKVHEELQIKFAGASKDLKMKVDETKNEAEQIQHDVKSKLTDAKQDLKDKVDETKKEADKVQLKVKSKLTDAKQDAKDKVDKTKKEAEKVHEELKFKLTDATQDLRNKVNETRNEAEKALEDKVVETKREAEKVQQEVKSKLTDMQQDVKDKVDETKKEAEKVQQEVKSKLTDAKEDIKDKLDGTKKEAEKVQQEVQSKFTNTKQVLEDKVDETKKEAEKVQQEVKSKLTDIQQDVKDKVDGTKKEAEKVQQEVQSKFTNAKQDLEDKVDETKKEAEKVQQEVKSKLTDIQQDVKDKVDGTKKEAEKVQQEVKSKLTDAKQDIKDKLDGTKMEAEKVQHEVQSKFTNVKQDLETKVDETKKEAEKVQHEVKSKLTDIQKDVKDKVDETQKEAEKVQHEVKSKLTNAKQDLEDNVIKTKIEAEKVQQEAKSKLADAKQDIEDKVADTKKEAEKIQHELKSKLTDAKQDVKDKFNETKKDTEKVKQEVKSKMTVAKQDIEDKVADTNKEAENVQQEVKSKLTDAKQDITDKFDGSKKEAEKVQQEFQSKFTNAKQDLKDKVDETKKEAEKIQQEVKSRLTDIQQDVKDKVDGTKNEAEKVQQEVKSELSDAKQNVEDKVAETKKEAEKVQQEVMSKLTDAKHDLEDKVAETKKEAEMVQQEIGSKLIDAKQDVENKVAETKKEAEQVQQDIRSKITDAKQDLEEKVADSKKEVSKVQQEVKSKFTDMKQDVKDKVDEMNKDVEKVQEGIKANMTDAKQDLKGKVVETKKEVEKVQQEFMSKLTDMKQDIKDNVDGTKKEVDKVKEDAKSKATDAKQDLKDKGIEIKKEAEKIQDQVKSKLIDAKQDIKDKVDEIEKEADKIHGDVIKKTNVKEDIKNKVDEFKKMDIFSDINDELCNNELFTNSKDSVAKNDAQDISNSGIDVLSSLQESLPNITDKTKDFLTTSTNTLTESNGDLVNQIDKILFDSENTVHTSKELANDNVPVVIPPARDEPNEICDAAVYKVGEDIVNSTFQEMKDVQFGGQRMQESHNGKKNKHSTKDGHRKISEQNIDLSNISHLSENYGTPKKVATKTKSDSVCYVTTPTMQRRNIGGSQRLSKDERPSLIDISHIRGDSSSDEDDYIVTEPADDYSPRRKKFSPVETISKNEHSKDCKSTMDNSSCSNDKHSADKRKPLFHIESEEDDSFDRGVQFDSASSVNQALDNSLKNTGIFSMGRLDNETMSKESDIQYDVDLIEKKISDINKALDSLEETENNKQDKTEHKLKRVERKFERMASETIEKDNEEAKMKQAVTSPEIEAKREEDFQKIVSQLSREEVSDSQNVYSNLWDEITFTPSEEWDSKTPDSPPEEIQDLPQGEIVYMGPVTLNKDNLINKAGMEIDIIPIKRSPCSSPQPRRAIKQNIRARSEIGFYPEKEIEDTTSLPDLERVEKKQPRFKEIQKGKIMSAVMKFNDEVLSRSYEMDSTSSSVYNSFQNISPFLRRQSDSVTKGSLVNIVKDWMAKSSPFGSSENVKSIETISLADTNISVYDDDDSIEISYSDCGASHMEHDTKSDNVLPDILVFDDENVPLIFLFDDNVNNVKDEPMEHLKNSCSMKNEQYKSSQEEASCGPLTHITSEGYAHLTPSTTDQDIIQTVPKPKPRTNKLTTDDSDINKSDIHTELRLDNEPITTEIDSYSDRKKFWETMSTTSNQEMIEKKCMSFHEEHSIAEDAHKKHPLEHELPSEPPVPKPRSTKTIASLEDQSYREEEVNAELSQHLVETKDSDEPAKLCSEYMASYKYPAQPKEVKISPKPEKSDSIDSEKEYISKFGALEAYENVGYESDSQEDMFDTDAEIIDHNIPQLKQRQMSVSQPPVAASRKTIYERSVSLPGEDLQEVSEQSVKARKRYFEEQIKNEIVIDQLMTQLDEEPVHEVKTLVEDIVSNAQKTVSSAPELVSKGNESLPTQSDLRFSPISSSSQDTKTEEDITQDTPGSIKDVSKCFQTATIKESTMDKSRTEQDMHFQDITHAAESEQFESSLTESSEDIKNVYSELEVNKEFLEDIEPKSEVKSTTESMEQEVAIKQQSTESDQSISSERSLELGSVGDLPVNITNGFHHKSDSMSKPSDSLEVHVDKSETEDSEKMTDNEQDFTSKSHSFEMRSYESAEHTPDIVLMERKLSFEEYESTHFDKEKIGSASVNLPKEHIPDTVWEVVQSQPLHEIQESVTEIPADETVSYDIATGPSKCENVSPESEQSNQYEVEKLILESLYHQKVHPDEAKKIAAELIDEIEMEIAKRNLNEGGESENDPPVPHPDVAKRQISEYLRQLAESKGLDEREVQLVESVLARKQSQISKLSRRDTQTSSMEITDEDLRYSGAECDLSPYESQDDILEEPTEQTEFEKSDSFEKQNKFSEQQETDEHKVVHYERDEEVYSGECDIKYKSEVNNKVQTHDKKTVDINYKEIKEDDKVKLELIEKETDNNIALGKLDISEVVQIKSEDSLCQIASSANIVDEEQHKSTSNLIQTETHSKDFSSKETNFGKADDDKIMLQGAYASELRSTEKIEGGVQDKFSSENIQISQDLHHEREEQTKQKEEIIISDDGVSLITIEKTEESRTKTEHVSQIVDQKIEETITTTEKIVPFQIDSKLESQPLTVNTATYIHDKLKQTFSDDSKSSHDESFKSPEEKSSSSSPRKDDTDNLKSTDVIFRKSRLGRDSSSSSGNLKADRKSGTDFETYSSSGESHYHSFEDSARSRPCSSDVEGLFGTGSSEYESALTTQDFSSKSHMTSGEYHTAVSSLSSRESMKSLDTESSGNMASMEVSEASETLVPSTFELDGDILDGVQTLEDELADERFDEELIDQELQKVKQSFESDSEVPGSSIDISEEDIEKPTNDEMTGKMKRSQEMTFQPEPKAIIADSPQSENAMEMDERFGTSLEDGSVLSMSLSSASDIAAVRTVIELSRRDSDKRDTSLTVSAESGQVSLEDSETLPRSFPDNLPASNASFDQKFVDIATSTAQTKDVFGVESVTITTTSIDENGIQSVSTQVTSQQSTNDEYTHEKQPVISQTDISFTNDDVTEPKRRGHRRNESTTFTPSMLSGFASVRSDKENEKINILTLKEVQFDEVKDVDETEKDENFKTEADQDYNKQQREANILEEEINVDECSISPYFDTQDDKPESELLELMQENSEDLLHEPIERPEAPEPPEQLESDETFIIKDHNSTKFTDSFMPTEPKRKSSGVFEEAEAEAAFSMVAHISPAHKAIPICPILEDEDAEKHELETRERVQKDIEHRRAQIMKDASPGSIPDITVTQHMTPLHDRGFHYPDLELEEKEVEELQKSTPQTPASNSSKSSEDTDQGREYVLEDAHSAILEEPEYENDEDISIDMHKFEKHDVTESITKPEDLPTLEEIKREVEIKLAETVQSSDSPNSDSFELLEQPDIIDDFVVIEEVAKEAAENDEEGKSVTIKETKYIRKHDEEVEEYLVRSAPTPLTRMTDLKYYPDGSSGDEGPFDFEDSPPTAAKKESVRVEDQSYEYERDLEANKKWIEMQFQGDQASMIAAGYGYEMDFERGPLEDIKEEEATDFDPSSSRIGSLESQKHSGGSLGSVKDSFSSTPEYDVLAGRKFFTRSGEHDDISMSSLQEFENLERVISLENRRYHQGSQDSSSNGSFTKRYHAGRGGQGDDISLSSLKEFEGLESACIAAHIVEVKAKEEEALLVQIDEGQESSNAAIESKTSHEKEEDDYEKRMFEIDEIIRQAQSNVEKFIDLGDKEESIGRGDSLEEVAKVPDLELDEPIIMKQPKSTTWSKDDPMETSLDSLADQKPTHHESTDSLEMKKTEIDLMTASTDSIEFQAQSKSGKTDNIMTDSIEIHDQDSRSCIVNSDSLELTQGTQGNVTILSDSIDEDGSRIGEYLIGHDQSSSSGRGDDLSSSGKEDNAEAAHIENQCAEFLIGSTDSLDPTSSTATHATYQYETDSVMSSSFTSGGSNTMVSSTDTIDQHGSKTCGVDIATAVRRVWFDDETFDATKHFTTEFLDDGSKPFVTEVIEPCEDDQDFSHTIHRRVELPPEIKKITFHGPDADLQLRQYVENFGEGEEVQESEEIDKDGNVHVKRVVQKRFIVKSDGDGTENKLSGPELEAYLQKISAMQGDFDLKYKDPSEFESTSTDTKDFHEDHMQHVSTHDIIYQQETSGTNQEATSMTVAGTAASQPMRAQGTRRRPLRYDISIDDQTEVDPREHDWRFNLNIHAEETEEGSTQHHSQDLHELSSEMKELLEEMEKQAKK